MLLIEEKLGGPDEPVDIYDWLAAQRHAGKSLQEVVREIERRTSVQTTPQTVNNWLRTPQPRTPTGTGQGR